MHKLGDNITYPTVDDNYASFVSKLLKTDKKFSCFSKKRTFEDVKKISDVVTCYGFANEDIFRHICILDVFDKVMPQCHDLTHKIDCFKMLNEEFENINDIYYIFDDVNFTLNSHTTKSEFYQQVMNDLNPKPIETFKSFCCFFNLNGFTFLIDASNLKIFSTDIKDFYKKQSDIMKIVERHLIKKGATKKPQVATILCSNGNYFLDYSDVNKMDVDIAYNYNDDFVSINKLISDKLSNESKGIIFLHGEPGTGKTCYIRYLIGTIKKRFIFLPTYLGDSVFSPPFLTFLQQQCKNSVMIFEDCERFVKSREHSNSGNSISDFLNMTDGIMSDVLGIQFVCTFNTKLSTVDKAFLRKGRLIAEYEFKKLSFEKSNALSKKIHKKELTKKGEHSLSEIYNLEDVPLSSNDKTKTIGYTR